MAQLIAPGNTDLSSAEFSLAAGESATIYLKPASNAVENVPPDAVADVQIKTSDLGFVTIQRLTGRDERATVLQAVGTFRVVRRAGGNCGVEKN